MHAPEIPPYEPIPESHSRLRHIWRRSLLVCVFVTVVFGFVGYRQQDAKETALDAVYNAVQLVVLHAPHAEGDMPRMLEVAKLAGLFASGLLAIGAIVFLLREEREAGRLGRMKGHVIVCGLGRHGWMAVRQLRSGKAPRSVVVVEASPAPGDVKACRDLGVIVVVGDATRPDVLKYARVGFAELLLAVCPKDNTNCEIAAVARQVRKDGDPDAPPLLCRVQVGNMETRESFQKLVSQASGSNPVDVRFVDSYDPEARQLVVEGLPIDHDGIMPGDTRQVHLVIIGFGCMGRAVAIRAAQLGIFAPDRKLKISVIDRVAEEHSRALHFHHRYVNDVCDITFYQMEALSPEARVLYEKWFAPGDAITSVAICFDDEELSLDLAVRLQPLIAETSVRMVARMARTSGLTGLINQNAAGVLKCRAFGGGDYSLNDDKWEEMAKAIHECYRNLRRAHAEGDAEKQAKLKTDDSMKDWHKLQEDLRESNRQQALHIPIKLRTVGLKLVRKEERGEEVGVFTDAQVMILGEIEHRRWLVGRRMDNWSYQSVKNIAKRESPSIVPWSELSSEMKEYDFQAVRQIPDILQLAGWKMCRA
jgi:hypothetical protein